MVIRLPIQADQLIMLRRLPLMIIKTYRNVEKYLMEAPEYLELITVQKYLMKRKALEYMDIQG